jgi:hypothetical protein
MLIYVLVVGVCLGLHVKVPDHEDVLIGPYLWRLVDESFEARP